MWIWLSVSCDGAELRLNASGCHVTAGESGTNCWLLWRNLSSCEQRRECNKISEEGEIMKQCARVGQNWKPKTYVGLKVENNRCGKGSRLTIRKAWRYWTVLQTLVQKNKILSYSNQLLIDFCVHKYYKYATERDLDVPSYKQVV
jgi:hypothetical protein